MATVAPTTTQPAAVVTGPLGLAAPRRKMSMEEFLALPDDGIDRDLIRGELREWGMTVRNRLHGFSTSLICGLLAEWWQSKMSKRGQVMVGDQVKITSQSLVQGHRRVGPDELVIRGRSLSQEFLLLFL